MTPYVYQPLNSADQHVRLLDLLPGSGRIKCHLRHVSITKIQDEYEALSYSWGAPTTQKFKILVNGLVCSVTPNLHAGLLRLRQFGRGSPRTLWIDAICINQSDDDEKNMQIPLMGDIYSLCSRVIVWLGEHDSFTESAFKGIKFMASRSHIGEKFNYYDWRQVKSDEKPDSPSRRVLLKKRLNTIESGAAFNSLFSRPWFRRVWVIQEVALSPSAIVMCGKFQINWDLIAKAHTISKTNFEVNNHLGTILRFRNWPSDLTDDILCHMIMAWHKEATDLKDKIYGLMGLEDMHNGEALIKVNYKADINQIFIYFTKRYLNRTCNLQVLAICRGCKVKGPSPTSYPSWAIDYDYDGNQEPLPHELISWGFNRWEAYPQGFSAGGRIPYQPCFSEDLLGLHGFQFDSVAAVSAVSTSAPAQYGNTSISGGMRGLTSAVAFYSIYFKGGIASWKSAISFCQFYLDARKMCRDSNIGDIYRPTGQVTLDAFWQVIRGRRLPIEHPDSEPGARKLFEDVDELLTRQAGQAATVKSIVSITREIVGNPSYMEFFSLVGITKQRRFFITQKGYIGLGPRETKVDDKIVILQGYQVPILARCTISDDFRVVGDSYVHGIMEGEMFDEQKCQLLWFE
ncbi:HET-domain-containing protein [Camillea tinctor]|nr:HET-domain-containing protein [Camillea tinctor]